jgi:1-deoxy-D-xylulose-5-phosphate reductoisomerase
VLNAANEVAVNAFLEKRIGFNAIPRVVARTMAAHTAVEEPELEAIIAADRWARRTAGELLPG